MFDTLIESDAAVERRTGGTAASVLIHAVLIGTATIATTHATREPERLEPVEVQYVAVPTPKEAPPVPRTVPPAGDAVAAPPIAPGFQTLVAPAHIPTVLPEIDLTQAVTNPGDFTGRGTPGGRGDGIIGGIVPAAGDATRAYTGIEVEKQVALAGGSPTPRYPEMLRTLGTEGRVVAQFVVGADGRVELDSFTVIESAHAQFDAAVREVLPRLRFRPAEVGGTAVRQLVQMPFVFSLGK